MKEVKNIVYLYSEVMPYAIAVMRALVHGYGVQVDCIYWDTYKRTPFVPVDEPGISFHKRSEFGTQSILQLIEERNPSIIYVTGRMDTGYLEVALLCRRKCIIVSGSDNQWTGSLKQRIAAALSQWLYRRYFEYFWVPGDRQYKYARKMGYAGSKIIRNLLTADTAVFGNVYEKNKKLKESRYPHTIVYAGRFAKEKGVDMLISAFNEAKQETVSNWQLTLVGAGETPEIADSLIEVREFMSGAELAAESKNWGVFCLPSEYEPWGVVIHEFAMAGFPIICSDNVGAADALVMDKDNGFIFESGNEEALKKTILQLMAKTDDELRAMGARSHELAKMYGPEIAAASLMSIVK